MSALKSFTHLQFEEALLERDNLQLERLFKALGGLFNESRSNLIQKDESHRYLLDEDMKSEVIVTVWKQLSSMARRKGVDHIKSIHGYSKTLVNGHIAIRVRRKIKREKRLKTFSLEDFNLDDSSLPLLEMNESFNRAEDYIQEKINNKVYRVPIEGQTVTIEMREIVSELKSKQLKEPTLYNTFYWLYLHGSKIQFVGELFGVSKATVNRRVETIKNLIYNMALSKMKIIEEIV